MYTAWLENWKAPIAMAESKSRCLEIALYVMTACVDHPIIGKTCRDLLDGELGQVDSPKLRISKDA